MRKIKAFIYALLGGMVAYTYGQRGDIGMALFITLFTIAIIALILSPIGRLKITWDDYGITLSVFAKKTTVIRWEELESLSLDHVGYHIKASTGRFKIRKKAMPESLLQRIKENIKINKSKQP
ncbi:MAG: hypothetical protein EA353_05560 [Puniceicoccaceae bacterium]|nr:MAG: hypothetical protein EA353_05560 [Puniceicoccaceae bacterium]